MRCIRKTGTTAGGIEYEKQQNEIQKQKLKTKLKQLEKMADMDVEDANDRVKIEEMVNS